MIHRFAKATLVSQMAVVGGLVLVPVFIAMLGEYAALLIIMVTAILGTWVGHRTNEWIVQDSCTQLSCLELGLIAGSAAAVQVVTRQVLIYAGLMELVEVHVPTSAELYLSVLAMPLGEEMFFRGWMWEKLEKLKLTPQAIGIITGFMFLLAHVPQRGFIYTAGLIPFTAYLSFIRHRWGLEGSTLAHSVFNGAAYALLLQALA